MSDPSQSDNQTQPPPNGLYLIHHSGRSGATYQRDQQTDTQEYGSKLKYLLSPANLSH
jgi:hypothetical protein